MMSYSQILELADEIGERAKEYGYEPFPLSDIDVDTIKRYPFPNIGSYRPEGWELEDYRTVDKTGMGYENEPALTLRGLNAWIKECQQLEGDHGMAIIEEGEFQIVIGLFKKGE